MRSSLAILVCSAALSPLGLLAAEPAAVHLRFESSDSVAGLQLDHAEHAVGGAGELVSPTKLANRGSLRFDGERSIAQLTLSAEQYGDLGEGFTWEGFFLTPAANTYTVDGAVGDRFLSQFILDKPGSTRLAIGLATTKENGPPHLSIALSGTTNRHDSKLPVAADVWHHFALVHTPGEAGGYLAWYLDYELAGRVVLDEKGARTTMSPGGDAPLAIGARLVEKGKADRGFAGLLDEIRITGEPLAPDQFLKVRQIVYERPVKLSLYAPLSEDFDGNYAALEPLETWQSEALALVDLPDVFSERGESRERRGPHGVVTEHELQLAAGPHTLLLRTTAAARLQIDGRSVIDARRSIVRDLPLDPLPATPRDYTATWQSDGRPHRFTLSAQYEADTGVNLGDVILAARAEPKKPAAAEANPAGNDTPINDADADADTNAGAWQLLGSAGDWPLNGASWAAYRGRAMQYYTSIESTRQAAAHQRGQLVWDRRHEQARQASSAWRVTPPAGEGHPIDRFAARHQPGGPLPKVDDATFFRRLSLDTRGRIPSYEELNAFLADERPNRRELAIDAALASDEWADQWVGYWQDVFAENPSILKPTLNNSGPFRKWIHQSLLHNHSLDRVATELMLMEGSDRAGGTAGFALATNNDAPMAMKAHVIMKAFAGIDMKCARCHDSPNADLQQGDLFSLAAMLNEGPLKLPATSIISTLPDGREPLVSTTLKAGQSLEPHWTLDEFVSRQAISQTVDPTARLRRQLAQIVTSPASPRFTDVMVNRVWKRYLGVGLVEPVDDWLVAGEPADPQLLRYLSGWFVDHGYDLKALARFIFTSRLYQSEIPGDVAVVEGSDQQPVASRIGPARRRLSAEQLVDSLHTAVGKPYDAEELTFDPNRTRGFLNLGIPERAWQMTSLSNERDRPALSMPGNLAIVDVLKTFGWRETRPDPITVRDHEPGPLQPLMLQNGLLAWRLMRLTEDSFVTELVLQEQTPEEFVQRLFLAILSRSPDAEEQQAFVELLSPGFDARGTGEAKPHLVRRPRARVDWDKHLDAEASVELLEAERIYREGDPATVRLSPEFRERAEDALWSLLNTPEFVFVP